MSDQKDLRYQLAGIDKAIRAVMVSGQEYKHEGRWVRRADLATLYRQRQLLAEQIAAAGGDTTVAVFDGR